ncbi:zinc finger MYND domain-containing protein, partial [Aspergillus glaucus CBS 516.65]
MADASCVVYKKQGTDATPLKRCAKCKTQWYCSRNCQKADWKNYKKTCAKSASETFAQSANTSKPSTNIANTAAFPKNLSTAVDKPFHRLESRTWLHDRPVKDVYQLLIDVYACAWKINTYLRE